MMVHLVKKKNYMVVHILLLTCTTTLLAKSNKAINL